jgi:hypothetical protein
MMPSIQPTENSRTQQTARPAVNREDLSFATMLAETVHHKSELSLATDVAPAAPVVSPLQGLAFLKQPNAMPLPSFLLSRWQPTHQNSSPTAVAPAAMARTEANPYSGALADLQTGSASFTPGVSTVGSPANLEASSVRPSTTALPLSAFPRPQNDTGRGIHWIPTTSQSREVIDKYVDEAVAMGIKWVTFLNDGANVGDNDYLVKKLVTNGIEPVMRIYTDGGAAVEGDLAKTVRHYKSLGVNYYQLYNEPNLRLENGGKAPDPQAYAAKWLHAARQVIAAGGYPGFASLSPTPGLAPGAAPGDMDDLQFLRQALQAVKAQDGNSALDRSWLSVHNYGRAHLRIRDYDAVVREELGRSLPQIGTEAGIYPGDTLSQQDATQIVADAYRYLNGREDYYFAYTYWIIANDSGLGHNDAAWNHQALFRPDGEAPLVNILKQERPI